MTGSGVVEMEKKNGVVAGKVVEAPEPAKLAEGKEDTLEKEDKPTNEIDPEECKKKGNKYFAGVFSQRCTLQSRPSLICQMALLLLLCFCLLSTENHYVLAVQWYSKAFELKPNAIYVSNRSFAQLRMENYGSAIDDATKAIELDPSYVKVRSFTRHLHSFPCFPLWVPLTISSG